MIMFKFKFDRSPVRRWSLSAAVALGLLIPAVPASFGQQEPSTAPVIAEELPSNPDLEAAEADMELTQPEVQQLQETLRDLGYFSGPADGRRGPRTREALRDFQTDQALPATGSLDSATVVRIGHQARMVGVPNQPPTDVIDRAGGMPDTLPATDAVPVDSSSAKVDPADPTAPPASSSKGGGGGIGAAADKTVDVLAGAGRATVKGTRVGGKAAVDGVVTAGKSTAKAGAVSGKAVATGATKTVDGTFYVGRKVADGSVFVASKTRDLFVGDKGSSREDEQIRQSLLSQYAADDRLIASEIDVKVAKGHVTLGAPEGARSDMNQASRLARITPGVKTVTTVFTSVSEQAAPEAAPEPTPEPIIPAGDPIVDPDMGAPAAPEEPSSPQR